MPLPGAPELDPKIRCVTDDGRTRTIVNFPGDFFHQPGFESGKTRISVHASGVGNHAIDIIAGSGTLITNTSSRTNASFDRNSNFILAVIRVRDNHNHSPDHTATQISNNIFGTGGAPLNLVRNICFDFSFTVMVCSFEISFAYFVSNYFPMCVTVIIGHWVSGVLGK